MFGRDMDGDDNTKDPLEFYTRDELIEELYRRHPDGLVLVTAGDSVRSDFRGPLTTSAGLIATAKIDVEAGITKNRHLLAPNDESMKDRL